MRAQTTNRFGPLQEGFAVDLEVGYHTITGPNNSGKSAVLQRAFRAVLETEGADVAVLLLPERTTVQGSAETGGRVLANYNSELNAQIAGSSTLPTPPNISELPRLLLTHHDLMGQARRLNALLGRLGYSDMIVKSGQALHFDDIQVAFQGSGLRSVFAILCALTDPSLRYVFVDEPELNLEPILQRQLRDLLIEHADTRAVWVATHSHLFLNRRNVHFNLVASRFDDGVSLTPVSDTQQLLDLTFRLLGNQIEDLFFPGNYLIVEGASDQVICEAIANLVGLTSGEVKVLPAGGITKLESQIGAVIASLTPLVVMDSPYAQRVVALIDHPGTEHRQPAEEIGRTIGDRLYVLPEGSIEEYLPDEIYERIGRSKPTVLEEISRLKHDFKALSTYKGVFSREVAAVLALGDLESVPVLRDAVQRAGRKGTPS
jgi:hypothetical protein